MFDFKHIISHGRKKIGILIGAGAPVSVNVEARLAMALLGKNKRYRFADVQRRHFNSTAPRGFLRVDAEDVIEKVLARTAGTIEAVAARLPVGFPQPGADTIFCMNCAEYEAAWRHAE